MSLEFRVLGKPEGDNALWVRVDSGQELTRLLFDCGEGCAAELPFGEVLETDGLFFSHHHMDHVSGFDRYFRANHARDSKENLIWGPPGTIGIMHHRFRGYLWNLHEQMSGRWRVRDVHPERVEEASFELVEAFEEAHPSPPAPRDGQRVWETGTCVVDALTMDHGAPALAYIVRERPKQNIAMDRVRELGLRPGPWMQGLKGDAEGEVEVGGVSHSLASLRETLLVETPGDSIAYLTDFLLDEAAMARLTEALDGVQTVVCESQYRHDDLALAVANRHMTTTLAATLAARAGVKELVLFHLSRRYRPVEWLEMLEEARAVFPATRFSREWEIDAS